MQPDLVNGLFELLGAYFVGLSIKRLWREKRVAGIDWKMMAFFTSWGFWNLFYYPHLDQWVSLSGGIAVTTANLTYLAMLLRYRRRS